MLKSDRLLMIMLVVNAGLPLGIARRDGGVDPSTHDLRIEHLNRPISAFSNCVVLIQVRNTIRA
jgi:hypothetical protein